MSRSSLTVGLLGLGIAGALLVPRLSGLHAEPAEIPETVVHVDVATMTPPVVIPEAPMVVVQPVVPEAVPVVPEVPAVPPQPAPLPRPARPRPIASRSVPLIPVSQRIPLIPELSEPPAPPVAPAPQVIVPEIGIEPGDWDGCPACGMG